MQCIRDNRYLYTETSSSCCTRGKPINITTNCTYLFNISLILKAPGPLPPILAIKKGQVSQETDLISVDEFIAKENPYLQFQNFIPNDEVATTSRVTSSEQAPSPSTNDSVNNSRRGRLDRSISQQLVQSSDSVATITHSSSVNSFLNNGSPARIPLVDATLSSSLSPLEIQIANANIYDGSQEQQDTSNQVVVQANPFCSQLPIVNARNNETADRSTEAIAIMEVVPNNPNNPSSQRPRWW